MVQLRRRFVSTDDIDAQQPFKNKHRCRRASAARAHRTTSQARAAGRAVSMPNATAQKAGPMPTDHGLGPDRKSSYITNGKLAPRSPTEGQRPRRPLSCEVFGRKGRFVGQSAGKGFADGQLLPGCVVPLLHCTMDCRHSRLERLGTKVVAISDSSQSTSRLTRQARGRRPVGQAATIPSVWKLAS